MKNEFYSLGIDVGSTTVKIVILDFDNNVLFSKYERHYSKVRETLINQLNLIKEQYKDKIVLLVSQKIVSLKHSDEILVLEDGRLVSSGPHSVLMKTCSVYQELYQSQFGTCSEQEVG